MDLTMNSSSTLRMSEKFCSIIMVCFRKGNFEREKVFQETMQRLLAYTKFPYELILIDNTQNNIGLGAARNLALDRAKGDYVCIMDDDVHVFPGWLEACIEIVNKNPDNYIATPLHVPRNIPWWKKHLRGEVDGYVWHARSGSNCMVMSLMTASKLGYFVNIHPSKDGVKYHDKIVRMGYKCLLTKEPMAIDTGFRKHSY